MVNARIAETYTLPSKGKIYEGEMNPEIIMSSMKTKHEMLRLSATEDSQKIMAEIIDDCLQTNVGMSSYDMCLGDYQFLLYKLREVTFGTEYEMSGQCPICGSPNHITVDLNTFAVKEYDESLPDLMFLDLPSDGTTLELTLQTPRVLDRINQQTREFRRKMKGARENPYILYSMLNSIVSKNGEDINPIEEEQWLRNLPLMDTNLIMDRIEKINNMIGIDLMVTRDCEVCGQEIHIPFRFTEEFFRPTV